MRPVVPILLLSWMSMVGASQRNFTYEANVLEDADPTPNSKAKNNATLAEIFDDAVDSYLSNDWKGCIDKFEEAQRGYKAYKKKIIICRRKCRGEVIDMAPLFSQNIEDLQFYERKVTETLCLLKCNQDYRNIANAQSLTRLPHHIEKKFLEFRVYEYLHICYYQESRYQDAANAIFTFLVYHPTNEMIAKNLRYYLDRPDVHKDEIVNLETPPFLKVYMKGVLSYEIEQYENAINYFENSIKSYLRSEEDCRFYCEGPFDQGWYPEFTSSIANHFTYCLQCKYGCSHLLNNFNGENREDLLRSHYNYLQFAYYKIHNLRAACAAVESYLLFDPTDDTMLYNRKYYSLLPNVKAEYFVPREEARYYVHRQKYEQNILRFISEKYRSIDLKRKNVTLKKKINKNKQDISVLDNEKFVKNDMKNETRENKITKLENIVPFNRLLAEENECDGRHRYVTDGFLNYTECNLLLQLAQLAVIEGDGYEANKSPHSIYELFEGVTIDRAALMVYFGLIKPDLLELLLRKTEAVLKHIKDYFNIDQQLYFTYTHLVCRSSLPDVSPSRNDLSHEIHADNCLINTEGTCYRKEPAYTWRDYSAIMYLNDDFEGGEFFFSDNHKSNRNEIKIQPVCGRMVAFSAGKENLHGVRGILKGKRCAVALWFTYDEKHFEYERILTEAILMRVHSEGPIKIQHIHLPMRYEATLIEQFKKDEKLQHFLQKALLRHQRYQ